MSAKLFDILMVFLKEFFEKFALEKNQQPTKKHEQFPKGQRGKSFTVFDCLRTSGLAQT